MNKSLKKDVKSTLSYIGEANLSAEDADVALDDYSSLNADNASDSINDMNKLIKVSYESTSKILNMNNIDKSLKKQLETVLSDISNVSIIDSNDVYNDINGTINAVEDAENSLTNAHDELAKVIQ